MYLYTYSNTCTYYTLIVIHVHMQYISHKLQVKKSWRSAKVVCEDSTPYHSAVIAEISMRYSEA